MSSQILGIHLPISFCHVVCRKAFVDDDSVQKKVIEYFASFDEHIKDFEIERVPHDTETKEETYKISALHKK